jgi:hypothetical protein
LVSTKKILINDKLQTGFYFLTENIGESFHPEFNPELTPSEMLELGVFGGKYMRDCQDEFPKSWFNDAKLAEGSKDPKLNFFGVDASLSLSEWENKGWIHPADPRGWFQWYCRYYYGRRIEEEDSRQIKRWKAMKRHVSAIEKNCPPLQLECRPKQRQALLHWAYDSRNI